MVEWRIQSLTCSLLHCIGGMDAIHLLADAAPQKRAILSSLSEGVRQLEDASSAIGLGDSVLKKSHPDFVRLVGKAAARYGEIAPDVKAAVKDGYPRIGFDTHHERMKRGLDSLARFADWTPTQIALEGVGGALSDNLAGNFQVSSMRDLMGNEMGEIAADINGFGSFIVGELPMESHPDPNLQTEGIPHVIKVSKFDRGLLALQQFPGAVFLESPVMWRLRHALMRVNALRFSRFQLMDRWHMNGVPKHFQDLMDRVSRGPYGGLAFPEVVKRLTGDAGISGDVDQDEFGNMFFANAQKSFPLATTATGVANIGILALIIRKRILSNGAFLFIDEPEAGLHPVWQVEMIRALLELARGGVNVVLATHSVDIVKYLDVHLQEHPELKELVELNHFTREGVVGGDKDLGERMDDIMLSLTDPFHKLCLDEIRASWSPS